jgi:hypothetical protein
MNDETGKIPATKQKPQTATTPVPSTEAMTSCKDKDVTERPRPVAVCECPPGLRWTSLLYLIAPPSL